MEIKQKDGTRVICALLVTVSSVFYYMTNSFPKEKGLTGSAYGSSFFPRIVLMFLIVVSIALFLQITFRKVKPSVEAVIRLNKVQLVRSLAIWGISLVFYWAWEKGGYFYTAPFYILAVSLLLGTKKWTHLVPMAAVAPLMYLVFEYFLKVGL